MGNALATINSRSTAIEIPQDYVPVAGIENLNADDFTLPVMKLVQATTKNIDDIEHKVGKWYRTDTGETHDEPNLIMIGIAKQRVLFQSEYDGTGKPLCRSDNGKEPRHEYIGITLDVPASLRIDPHPLGEKLARFDLRKRRHFRGIHREARHARSDRTAPTYRLRLCVFVVGRRQFFCRPSRR